MPSPLGATRHRGEERYGHMASDRATAKRDTLPDALFGVFARACVGVGMAVAGINAAVEKAPAWMLLTECPARLLRS